MHYNNLTDYLQSQKEWLKSFLFDILSIPSESGKEEKIQQCLYDIFKNFDVSCELIEIQNNIVKDPEYSDTIKDLDYTGRPNLKVENHETGGKTIVINSHVDVVPPSTGQRNPYSPCMDEKENIFARGACDAKGQIAAIALVLKAANDYIKLGQKIICHLVIEEEIGGNGTLAMIRHEKNTKVDAVINMEPTNLRIMPSIRGAVWFNICFSGKSGHAGATLNSTNPVYKAMHAIKILKEYHSKLENESKNYGLFKDIDNPMPLTIGQFISGEWPSMTPGGTLVRGVIGFLPNKTREEVIQGFVNELNKPKNAWVKEGMNLRFDYRHNAVELPVSHWLVKKMSEACLRCKAEYLPIAMTASTDAIYYHEMGIPVIAFGPGDIKYAHSAIEHINFNQIIKSAEIIISFIKGLN